MHGISYAAIIYHNNKLGMNHETITRLTNTKPNKPIVYTSKKKDKLRIVKIELPFTSPMPPSCE
jgi:hypothetical protein